MLWEPCKKLILAEMHEMRAFDFEICAIQVKMCSFYFEMHKTADFHSNL